MPIQQPIIPVLVSDYVGGKDGATVAAEIQKVWDSIK